MHKGCGCVRISLKQTISFSINKFKITGGVLMNKFSIHNKDIRRLMAVFMVILMSVSAVACGSKKKSSDAIVPGSSILPAPQKKIEEVPTNASNEIVISGVLANIDTVSNKLRFVDVNGGAEYEVPYTGGTDIRTKYNTVIPAASLEPGNIYKVTCDKRGVAAKIHGDGNAWDRGSITRLEVDEASKKLTAGSRTFTYSGHTVILSGGKRISIAEIVDVDEVSIYGVDDIVYAIVVDKGHGYIQFTGVDLFEGGYATLGRKNFVGISKSMLVTAPIGSYEVEVQKGSLVSSKEITVTDGGTTLVDFSDVTLEPTKTGAVNFRITPDNAVMSIDGVEIDYTKPITLSYGKHTLKLVANYYEAYEETFYVTSAYETKVVDMVSTTKTTAATQPASTDGYVVKVTAPVGAALYVDNMYIGVIPCTFEKKAGNRTITLSKNGFSKVSYTIQISNTAGDATYAFPDMTTAAATTGAATKATIGTD